MRIVLIGDASNVNIQRWVESLVQAGADVHILSFVQGPSTLSVHHLRPAPVGGRRVSYLWGGRSARRLVSVIDPDVVIGYYATGYGTTARLAGRHPLVQVPVGNDILVNPPGTVTHRMAEKNLAAADLVVAWSPHLARAAESFGVPSDRILTLLRGIPLDRFPETVAGSGDPRQLVVTRQLHPYYRHDVLVSAVAECSDSSVALTLYGGGPAQTDLQALAARLGLGERVHFGGVLSNDDVADALSRFGVYVSAVPTDGVSASLLEAMAIGLFPIIIDHVANRDWITHGETGFLVDPTPNSFAAAISELIAHPELIQAAARVNRERVRSRADLHRNSRCFLEEFAKLLMTPHGGPNRLG